jgi:hypothetical protein
MRGDGRLRRAWGTLTTALIGSNTLQYSMRDSLVRPRGWRKVRPVDYSRRRNAVPSRTRRLLACVGSFYSTVTISLKFTCFD